MREHLQHGGQAKAGVLQKGKVRDPRRMRGGGSDYVCWRRSETERGRLALIHLAKVKDP